MRWIPKTNDAPESIRVFLEENEPVGVNLTYKNSPLETGKLLRELVIDQGGLCAYTGVAIDERLSHRQSPGTGDGLVYYAHNEHLKPQSLCRQELLDRGEEPGRVAGEDVDHRNIVAALGVRGPGGRRKVELFGAVSRPPNTLLPLLPTQPDCESRFRYFADGRVEGVDPEAGTAIDHLKLNHPTLVSWRFEAWGVLETLPTEEADHLLEMLRETSKDEPFVEFSFVLENIWRQLRGDATPGVAV